jgi:hypothetical protein
MWKCKTKKREKKRWRERERRLENVLNKEEWTGNVGHKRQKQEEICYYTTLLQ